MAADELHTMSATLRFPFQASLDGFSMVETDGNLYYGLDSSELPVEPETITAEAAPEEMRSQQPPVAFHNPLRDSGLKDEEPNAATASPPVSMMPHRIDTSDQQRFATEHEMTAEQTQETAETEEDQTYCESPVSTIDLKDSIQQVEPPAAQIPARNGAPPRFYSTPLVKGDPNSTPVLLYGLEQPPDLRIRPRKLVSPLRPRSYYSAGPVRPSSRHGPSPVSPSMPPRIPEETESSTSARRLSVLLRRSSTYLPHKLAGPAVGSNASSGSASTISTIRSMATAATDDSNSNCASISTTPASSTSSLPTLKATAPLEQKPPSNMSSPNLVRADTTTTLGEDDLPRAPTPSSPARLIRRKTTSTVDGIPDNASVETSRRTSIFNFSFRNLPSLGHRRSNDTLNTIRAVVDDRQETASGNNKPDNNAFPLIRAPSKPMPYSPDSFISPHTEAGRGRAKYTTAPFPDNDTTSTTNDNDDYINDINTPRPHTSYNPTSGTTPTFSTTPRIRNFSLSRKLTPSEPLPKYKQQQDGGNRQNEKTGKQKNIAAAAAHRATKFLTRIFI